jgi:tRNA threonylcarbamoyladenosine biosynthesis protein TsaB
VYFFLFILGRQAVTQFLGIETATDACSVALYNEGRITELHEEIPRQHSQRLLPMVRELITLGRNPGDSLSAIVLGAGPGSFTGLRIAASCAQGLAYAWQLPAIAISTLDIQVSTAKRQGLVEEGDTVLSMIDANIGETYWAIYRVCAGRHELLEGPRVSRPELLLPVQDYPDLVAVGNGCHCLVQSPNTLRDVIARQYPDLLPHAQDLFPTALVKLAAGEILEPQAIQPLYVREEVSWKKLSEQGKSQSPDKGHGSLAT